MVAEAPCIMNMTILMQLSPLSTRCPNHPAQLAPPAEHTQPLIPTTLNLIATNITMTWIRDIVSPAVVLVLANLEFLIVVVIVSFLVWLIPQRYRRHEERERQHFLRLTHQLQPRSRQRKKRQPQIEYFRQQEPTSPSSEQLNFDSALCENCHKFFFFLAQIYQKA